MLGRADLVVDVAHRLCCGVAHHIRQRDRCSAGLHLNEDGDVDLAILTVVLAFNFIGDSLRDALDPRTARALRVHEGG